MTTFEIVLLIALIGVIALYVTSKLSKNKSITEVLKEVKDDLKGTANNVVDLVNKAKDIVFDDNIQKAIKEFILIVEEKNTIAKAKGEQYLSGDDKKKEVILRLSEWVSNTTGSLTKAVEFVESNESKINSIIDEYVSFSNKMEGKNTLSEAERLIEEHLNSK